MHANRIKSLGGIILGTAVGDALGLPDEGLSPGRIGRWRRGKVGHRFVFGRGMISDDTEHTIFVCQALLEHPDDPDAFARSLAGQLRWWLAAVPAGIGWATLRAAIKLWLGFSPSRSGVFSAGNGPAMRSAIVGGYFAGDPAGIWAFTAASTLITHTDPRALTAASAVAAASAWSVLHGPDQAPGGSDITDLFLPLSRPNDGEWPDMVNRMTGAYSSGRTVSRFSESLDPAGRGVSGYAYRTVPVALFAWWRHYGDFRSTVESVLACGGDTDTVGAVAGAMAGAVVGHDGIPHEWIEGILEWPRSVRFMRRAAARLADQAPGDKGSGRVRYFWPALLPRNILFLVLVMLHGLRRLLPPY
ncbi:MAG: ADP-ribosylglycohydrolase family protein [Pseudomonadota bacterium]